MPFIGSTPDRVFPMVSDVEDLLVIGAGAAGLCAAWVGLRRGWRPLVIDRTESIGGLWARVRPEMRCLSLRYRDQFPDGSGPIGAGPRASAAEVLIAIEAFAARMWPSYKFGCRALSLRPCREGLLVETDAGPVRARRVVVATGEYGCPRSIELPGRFDGPIVHSSAFSPEDVRAGERVLVVGAGNSGAEAAELAAARGASVYLAARRPIGRQPAVIGGVQGEVLFWLSGLRVDRLPFRGGCRPRTPVINPWLYEALATRAIEMVGPALALHARAVEVPDGRRVECDRVVLATGFRRDTAWLAPEVRLAADGTPAHRGGFALGVRGVGFLGIPCMRTWRSGFLRGLAADAAAVVGGLE
jgi:putative flavoprotein involved in K+ transport